MLDRCEKIEAIPIDVPADGNCLIWSVLRLLEGESAGQSSPEDAHRNMMELREGLKNMWLSKQDDRRWVELFRMCDWLWEGFVDKPEKPEQSVPKAETKAEKADKPDAQVKLEMTPKKRRKPNAPINIDLTTPPHVSPAQKRRTVDHVGECRPAKRLERTEVREEGFRLPGQNAQRSSFLEPAVKDIEEAFAESKKTIKQVHAPAAKKVKSEPAVVPTTPQDQDPLAHIPVGELDESTLEAALAELVPEGGEEQLCVATRPTRTRHKDGLGKHRRSCLRRVVSTSEQDLKRVKKYLSTNGLSYGEFMRYHKRLCELAKAGVCTDGGYVQFQHRLRKSTLPQCEACKQAMTTLGITMQAIQECMREPDHDGRDEDGNAGDEVKDQPAQVSAEEGQGQIVRVMEGGEPEDGEPKDLPEAPQSELDQCIAFVKSYAPHIELVMGSNEKGYALAYRCRLCSTRGSPYGKLNTLVVAKIGSVRKFLLQHVDASTHQKNLAKWRVLERLQNEEPLAQMECKGLRVSDTTAGSLHHYQSEFALWAAFSRVGSKLAKHEVWWDVSTNEWYVRHHECKKTTTEANSSQACSLCRGLAEPRRLQRTVLQFVSKYSAGRLLNSKLFGTKQQTDEIVLEISRTAFAQRHSVYWNKVLGLNLMNLQQLVRNHFQHLDSESSTDRMKEFTSSIIKPCLQVNAASISTKLPALSLAFANALGNGDLTEMESVSVQIAQFSVSGRLDANPLLQGILVQCMKKIGRDEEFKTMRGRNSGSMNDTARSLADDAAITLSMLCSNQELARQLGQNAKPVPVVMERLSQNGLPNPMLALCEDAREQLRSNFVHIDQAYPRGPGAPAKRLICAVDCTYLVKSFTQAMFNSRAGLVGGFWSPMDEATSFMQLSNLPADATKRAKANLMLACVVWDPCSKHRRTLSAAEMPMKLKATSEPGVESTERGAGNRATWPCCAHFLIFLQYRNIMKQYETN